MALGRGLRVYHSPNTQAQPYAVLLEQRGQQQCLLLQSQAIMCLSSEEGEEVKTNLVKLCDAFGVVGNLRYTSSQGVLHYLVLVTGCVSVGKLDTSEVYKITDCKLLSLRGYTPDEEKVSEVKKLLSSGAAYFSWSSQGPDQSVDLTLSAQRSYTCPGVTDSRFFWNRTLHLPYIRAGIDTTAWLVRIMFGSVEMRTVYAGSRQVRSVLISRLSNERAGTRFEVRGLDDDGHVANCVETEQMLIMDSLCTSFVQIRGSVPLFWEQPGLNVGSHKIKIARSPELAAPAFERHFDQLTAHYGSLAIINLLGSNLVGSKEGEANLSTAYQSQQKTSGHRNIPHILWDFHAEGGVKSLDKLEGPVDNLLGSQLTYFSAGSGMVGVQTGVVRTNCTDCLDRTNAVQMWLGLRILTKQLVSMGVEMKEHTVTRFQDTFRQMWVNNGNGLSKIYAGTAALSQGGSKLRDGVRSAARTIQNNLLDKDKQGAFDLLVHGTGRFTDFSDRSRLLLPAEYWTAPAPLQQALSKYWVDYTYSEPVRVAVGTYNINGGKHFRSVVYKDVSLDDWLLDGWREGNFNQGLVSLDTNVKDTRPADIYAVGFEEMVDLDAKNIVNASGENARGWAEELAKTLNRNTKYSLVTYHQLVGVCLYVFIRPELAVNVREVMVEEVKTAMGGTTGNKGAVAISFTYAASSFCFLCSHFSAHQNQVQERNNDYSEAVKRIAFDNGRTVLSHDYVFWCGDFNYRINLEREEVIEAVGKKDWSTLHTADQLQIEHGAGNVFQGFHEGQILFPPTYKYDLFSDDYDTSEKCRVPAWTDRVLWRRRTPQGPLPDDWSEGRVVWYGRAELKQSDHRPVLAVIDIQARKVDTAKREQVISDLLSKLGTHDGTVVVTPCTNVVDITDELVEAVNSTLGEWGEVVYSRSVRGSVWTQYRSCDSAIHVLGRMVRAGGVEWQISPHHQNWSASLAEELSIAKTSKIPVKKQVTQPSVKKPPPRPSAPPSRPSAPPTRIPNHGQNGGRTDMPKPIRPAPAPPGTDTDSDFFSSSPVTSVASTVSNYSLACLTWPEDDDIPVPSGNNVYQAPPVPSRTSILSSEPPPFSPPTLPSAFSTSAPPSEPPPALPRIPDRPVLPPPVPRRR